MIKNEMKKRYKDYILNISNHYERKTFEFDNLDELMSNIKMSIDFEKNMIDMIYLDDKHWFQLEIQCTTRQFEDIGCFKRFYKQSKEVVFLKELFNIDVPMSLFNRYLKIVYETTIKDVYKEVLNTKQDEMDKIREREKESNPLHELLVPTFEIASNSTITLDEIRQRRYYIVDRAQIRAKDSITKNKPIQLPE